MSGSVLFCSADIAGTGIRELGVFVRVAVLLGQCGGVWAFIVRVVGGNVWFSGLAE